MLRGQRERLQQLDQTSDMELVKKWAWTSAIVGALFAFVAMPLLLTAIHMVLPLLLRQLLWAFTKVCMALACAMFAAAAYVTFARSDSWE